MPGLVVRIDTSEALSATTRLRRNLTDLGADSRLTEQEIRNLEQRLTRGMGTDRARASLEEMRRSCNMTAVEFARLQRQLGDSRGALNTLGEAVGNTVKRFANLQNALLGGAIGAFITKITQTGAAYEKQMATVSGIMKATSADMAAMDAEARRLGASTEWSASQAGEALQFMGMAGWTAQQSISGLAPALDLATAGQIDLGRASDIATDTLTAMGMQSKDAAQNLANFTRLNDVMVSTITKSNTNIQLLGTSFKYTAPIASQLGYSIEELSAVLGVLANSGIKGEMAGSSMVQVFMKLKKAQGELGIESDNLIDVMEAIGKAQWDATKIGEVFGTEHVKTVNVLKAGIPEYEKLTEANKNAAGEAKKLADVMRDNVDGAMKGLASTIEGTVIDIFNKYKDVIKGSLEYATNMIRDNKEEILTFVDALVTAGGIFATSQFFKTIAEIPDMADGAVEAFKSMTEVVGEGEISLEAFKNSTEKVKYSVETLSSVGMAFTAGWQVGTWLKDNFEEARLAGVFMGEGLAIVFENMMAAGKIFAAAIMYIWVDISETAEIAWLNISKGFDIAVTGMKQLGIALIEGLTSGWITIEYAAKTAFAGMQGFFGEVLKKMLDKLGEFIGTAIKALSNMPFMEGVAEKMTAGFENVKAKIANMSGMSDSLAQVNAEKQKAVAINKDIISQMVGETKSISDISSAYDKQISSVSKNASERKKMLADEVKMISETAEANKKAIHEVAQEDAMATENAKAKMIMEEAKELQSKKAQKAYSDEAIRMKALAGAMDDSKGKSKEFLDQQNKLKEAFKDDPYYKQEQSLKKFKEELTNSDAYRAAAAYYGEDKAKLESWVQGKVAAYEQEQTGRVKSLDKGNKAAAKAMSSFADDYKKATMNAFDYEVDKLNEIKKQYEKDGMDKIKIQEWYTAEYKKLLDQKKENEEKAIGNAAKQAAELYEDELKAFENFIGKEENFNNERLDDAEKIYEQIKDSAEGSMQEILDIEEMGVAEQKALKDQLFEHEKMLAEKRKELAAEQKELRNDFYADMAGESEFAAGVNYQNQIEELNNYVAKLREAGADEETIQKHITETTKELQIEKMEASDDFVDGWKRGLMEMTQEETTWADASYGIFKNFAQETKSAIGDSLFSVMKGDMDGVKDAWKSMMDSMLKKLADTVANMLVEWAATKAMGALDIGVSGSGGGGSGGIMGSVLSGVGSLVSNSWDTISDWGSTAWTAVSDWWSSWHTGLYNAPDEHLAWIDKGEMVIPPEMAERVRRGEMPTRAEFEALPKYRTGLYEATEAHLAVIHDGEMIANTRDVVPDMSFVNNIVSIGKDGIPIDVTVTVENTTTENDNSEAVAAQQALAEEQMDAAQTAAYLNTGLRATGKILENMGANQAIGNIIEYGSVSGGAEYVSGWEASAGVDTGTSALGSINYVGGAVKLISDIAGDGLFSNQYDNEALGVLQTVGAFTKYGGVLSTAGEWLGGMLGEEGAQIGSGIGAGAGIGATVGSVIPGVGTVIGAAVGAIVGGITSALGMSRHRDWKTGVGTENLGFYEEADPQLSAVRMGEGRAATAPVITDSIRAGQKTVWDTMDIVYENVPEQYVEKLKENISKERIEIGGDKWVVRESWAQKDIMTIASETARRMYSAAVPHVEEMGNSLIADYDQEFGKYIQGTQLGALSEKLKTGIDPGEGYATVEEKWLALREAGTASDSSEGGAKMLEEAIATMAQDMGLYIESLKVFQEKAEALRKVFSENGDVFEILDPAVTEGYKTMLASDNEEIKAQALEGLNQTRAFVAGFYENVVQPMQDGGISVSEYAEAVNSMNTAFGEYSASAQQLGMNQEMLGLIEEQRGLYLEKLNEEYKKERDELVKTVAEKYGLMAAESEYSQVLQDVNKDVDSLVEQYKNLGGTSEELAAIEEGRALILSKIAEDYKQQVNELISTAAEKFGYTEENTEYEQAIEETNQYLDELIARMKDLGATAEQVAVVEAERANILNDVAKEYEKERENLKRYAVEIVQPVSEYQQVINGINEEFDGIAQSMRAAGGSIEDINFVDQIRNIALVQAKNEEQLRRKLEIEEKISRATANALAEVNNLIANISKNLQASRDLMAKNSWMASTGGSSNDYLWHQMEEMMSGGTNLEGLSQMSGMLSQWYSSALSEAEQVKSSASSLSSAGSSAGSAISAGAADLTGAIEDLIKSIEDTINNIKYSGLNVALTDKKREEAKNDYEELKAKAFSGEATQEDMNEFMSFASQYLTQSQADLKSSSAYQDIYAGVMQDLEDLKNQTPVIAANSQTAQSAVTGGYSGYSGGTSGDFFSLLDGQNENKNIDEQFEKMAAYIEEQTALLKEKEIILRIDWAQVSGDTAATMELLRPIIEKHGWDSEVSLLFVAEMSKNFTGTIEDYANMLGFIVEDSGGWHSDATISFISNMDLWEDANFDDLMASIGFLKGEYGWESEATLNFVAKTAKGFTGSLTEMAEMLGFIVEDSGGWHSDATISFITNMNLWDDITIEDAMESLNFLGTEYGWESEATISFVSKLKNSGINWNYIKSTLKAHGVTDETVLKTIEATYSGNITSAEAKELLAVSGNDVSVRKAVEGVYSGNMTLADAKMMLEKSGIPESSKILVEAMVQTQVQTWMDPVFYEFASTTKLMDATLADLGATMRQSLMGQYSEYSMADGFLLLYTPLAAIEANTARLNSGLGFAYGGIATGPESGYTATLHGTELIVSPKASYPATVVGGNGGGTDRELLQILINKLDNIGNKDTIIENKISLELDKKPIAQVAEDVIVTREERNIKGRVLTR